MCHQFYSEIYGLHEQMNKWADFSGTESKKCITTSDVKISHDVNKGEDADKVCSVFQGVTFDKCNVKLVIILQTAITCEIAHHSVTFFEGNKISFLA